MSSSFSAHDRVHDLAHNLAHNLIDELIRTLQDMAEQGWHGLDCSPQTLAVIRNWGASSAVSSRPDTLPQIQKDLGQCQRCALCQSRTHIIFGRGAPNAKLMFIGAEIEEEDDLKAQPFSGEAGRLLTRIIAAMNLTREDVYLTHIVKCRPPNQRHPLKSEIERCKPFLDRQIEVIAPTVICSLGRLATQVLLKTDQSISKARGRFYDYHGIKVMPTFHPADLLRHPRKKRDTWIDIQKIMHLLNIPVNIPVK
jgi:uracil-DNA glycosylase family 4